MSSWVEVEITDEIMEAARAYSNRVGYIKNSIRKGGGNMPGFLGEIVVGTYIKRNLHADIKSKPCKDYDMILYRDECEVLIDAKTKQRSVEPKKEYTCHVADASMHQKCDVYIFCQVNMYPQKRAWILGWMTKKEFLEKCIHLNKGESLKDVGFNDDDFKQHADTNVVLISELRDIKDIVS